MVITTYTGQKPRSMTLIAKTEFMQEAITKLQEELYGNRGE